MHYLTKQLVVWCLKK